jgi:hypothetical protein
MDNIQYSSACVKEMCAVSFIKSMLIVISFGYIFVNMF